MKESETPIDGLDSFDRNVRLSTLRRLAADASAFPPCGENVNLHLHSFFSYNAAGYSPCHIAWRARQAGLYAAAICDFDVLDGMDEFAEAGLTVGLRTAVHLEALRTLGVTPAHRKSFAPVKNLLAIDAAE